MCVTSQASHVVPDLDCACRSGRVCLMLIAARERSSLSLERPVPHHAVYIISKHELVFQFKTNTTESEKTPSPHKAAMLYVLLIFPTVNDNILDSFMHRNVVHTT
jgi:hypothetical protein